VIAADGPMMFLNLRSVTFALFAPASVV